MYIKETRQDIYTYIFYALKSFSSRTDTEKGSFFSGIFGAFNDFGRNSVDLQASKMLNIAKRIFISWDSFTPKLAEADITSEKEYKKQVNGKF